MTLSFSKEIGGYFELEVNPMFDNMSNNIALNCARNCLRYVIKAFQIKEIYVPFYTCPVVWQSIKKEDCNIIFYHIDENFMPIINCKENAYILYTNYFGVCSKNIKNLASKYKNLIIDNAQAFYMPKYGIASFNSIRKFFGVSDGALLQTDKILNENIEQDASYGRFSHLIKRLDINAQFGYQDFCQNDDSFNNENIKTLSKTTTKIFNSINIEKAKEKRLENFNYLHQYLLNENKLQLLLDKEDVPMVYPYLIEDEKLRTKLIKNKIYVATYWEPQPLNTQESFFQKYLLPLPIDQRYDTEDLKRILEVINGKN